MNTLAALLVAAALLADPAGPTPGGTLDLAPPPGSSWNVVVPSPGVSGEVSAHGLVLLARLSTQQSGTGRRPADALPWVTVTVTGPAATEVPGTLRFDEDHGVLVWRAADGLAPAASYTARVRTDNEGLATAWGDFVFALPDIDQSFTFRTAATFSGPAVAPEITLRSAAEVVHTETVCCSTFGHVICVAEGDCLGCQEDRVWRPMIELAWPVRASNPMVGHLRYRAWLEGPSGYELTAYPALLDTPGEAHIEADIDVPLERYCLVAEERHLVDGTSETTRTCLDAAAVAPGSNDPPAQPVDASMCHDPTEVEGCAGGDPSPLGAGIAAALLLTCLRRRRQA